MPVDRIDDYRARVVGPVRFLNNLLESWQLEAMQVIVLLGLDPGDEPYAGAVLTGWIPLKGRDASDRSRPPRLREDRFESW